MWLKNSINFFYLPNSQGELLAPNNRQIVYKFLSRIVVKRLKRDHLKILG